MTDYTEYDCMCWEKDEFGKTLCCDPPQCEINFCPVKQLLAQVESVKKWRDRWGLSLSDRQYRELTEILQSSTQRTNEHE